MEGFDYLKMKPDSTLVTASPGIKAQVLAESGKQYAIYVFGKGPHTFELTVPAGNYVLNYGPAHRKLRKTQVYWIMAFQLTSPVYRKTCGEIITIICSSLRYLFSLRRKTIHLLAFD
jgi:hypothetical protein